MQSRRRVRLHKPLGAVGQLLQQHPGALQVQRFALVAERGVDLTQEAAGFHLPALALPQAPQAHRRPELKRSRLLTARNLEGLAKGLLCRNQLFRMARQEQLSLQSV